MSSLRDFDRLLKDSMGLDVASIGKSALARAVSERQRACHLDDARSYWDRARTSDVERQALIEAVVVPETWFFRDREAFRALVQFAIVEWLPAHAAGRLRVLSLPCSTGEEPYSIAMALLDVGMPASRFSIDAVDISQRALTRGQLGVYRGSSFRGDELSFRNRYFTAGAAGHQVSDAVRLQVRFQQGNLLDPAFLPGAALYDVIFCRNMLIYFDQATQGRAVTVLSRLLSPKGILFAGSSESAVFLNHEFTPARVPMAFAFRKGRPGQAGLGETGNSSKRPVRSRTHIRQAVDVSRTAALPAPVPDANPRIAAGIDEAVRLADEGRLVEAASVCEDYLRRQGPSADGLYLLGLVHDGTGHPSEAITCYRKALYLEPRHADALVHLALLMEQQGQHVEARLLLNRASRLSPQRGV
jgi:chemotaxis protein methyltransferase WspC